MKGLAIGPAVLLLASLCLAEEPTSSSPSVLLTGSKFRLIREVQSQTRDLFELAIEAGMYQRKGQEYLPGAERGAVSAGGRTWHGSNGVGLVAYNPPMQRFSIYYLRDQAVPGHHLRILYADDDLLFFSYGAHQDVPQPPALEVYSLKLQQFARVDRISTRHGRFGYFAAEMLWAKTPGGHMPQIGWDDRRYAHGNWVPLGDAGLCHPDKMVLENGTFKLLYHTGWDVEEFVTELQFSKSDVERQLQRLTQKDPVPSGQPAAPMVGLWQERPKR